MWRPIFKGVIWLGLIIVVAVVSANATGLILAEQVGERTTFTITMTWLALFGGAAVMIWAGWPRRRYEADDESQPPVRRRRLGWERYRKL